MSEIYRQPEQKALTIKEKLLLTAGSLAIVPLAILAYPDPFPRKKSRLSNEQHQQAELERKQRIEQFKANEGKPYDDRLEPISQLSSYMVSVIKGVHESLAFRTSSVDSDYPNHFETESIGEVEMYRDILIMLGQNDVGGPLIKDEEVHQFSSEEVVGLLEQFKYFRKTSQNTKPPSYEPYLAAGKARALESLLTHLGQSELIMEINHQTLKFLNSSD